MTLIQLVDPDGYPAGLSEKRAAHENGGQLHRAVSVVLIDPAGRVLLQKRALDKYHFAGLWANSCCTHPQNDESPREAAERALLCELGIHAPLEEITTMTYAAQDPQTGLWEREYDHIFLGLWTGALSPNRQEVAEIVWMSAAELQDALENDPERFAPWLKEIINALGRSNSSLIGDNRPQSDREDRSMAF